MYMDVNYFLSFINQIAFINFFLFIWFHTTAFIEYMKLFRLTNLFRINKYIDYKNINPSISYIDFLSIKNPNFLTKLFSCPYCLNFWLTLFSTILFNNIFIFPLIYMFSIIIYIILKRYIYE
jgi:hypothetical protein